MTARVLVAYATRHGSNAEIAAAIADELRRAGLAADVSEAGSVRSIDQYSAAVVGSAVYHGRWQGDAIEFLKRFERGLSQRPSWLFSSGPTGGTPESDASVAAANAAPEGQPPPKEVAKYAKRIGARGHAAFGGRVGDNMTGLLERWMPRGDWRDFEQIRLWARQLARLLVVDQARA